MDAGIGFDGLAKHLQCLFGLFGTEVTCGQLIEDGGISEHALGDAAPEGKRLFHLPLIGKEVADTQKVFPLVDRVDDRCLAELDDRLFERIAHHVRDRFSQVAGNKKRITVERVGKESQAEGGSRHVAGIEAERLLGGAAFEAGETEIIRRRLLLNVSDTPGRHRIIPSVEVIL